MFEEQFIQQSETTSHVPAPLMSYVDGELARLNEEVERLRQYRITNFDALDKIKVFQQIKAQLSLPKPQYEGLATHLQTEREQAELELASLQGQMRPLSL